MRISKTFIPTLKETPADAVITSHILMLRAGLVRQLSAGIYSFLPVGYKIIQKISDVIRKEMNNVGGQEFHLPALNPREIWEATNRVEAFGDTLFHIKNANRDYILAPTHEEIMCYHAKGEIKSYKDMPQMWYQIQTKFRNEARPRSGVIRGRQFLMKDAYTFDKSFEDLDVAYADIEKAYRTIFDKCGIKYFVVGAASGAMGGNKSEEFMVKSEAGEDIVAHCEKCGYAANIEVATSIVDELNRDADSKELEEIHTPNVKSIDELCEFLKIDETKCAKSRIYICEEKPILILMLGNEDVNESKLETYLGAQVRPAHPDELKEISGADAGSIGPINYKGRVIIDNRLKNQNNMVSGANKNDYHIGGIDFNRDIKDAEYADLRVAQSGEKCPRCQETFDVFKAIELGHIFKLGTKYSEGLGAKFLDEDGKEKPIVMGSYGIGVERVFACYVEQNNDEKGIIFDNKYLQPFQLEVIGLNMKKETVAEAGEKIYNDLQKMDYDVLFDDRRDAQAGFKFKDAELLGVPVQIVIGEKNLKEGLVEIKIRRTDERFTVKLEELYDKLKELV